MAQNARTRFTTQEAMYYLRSRPQICDMSEQQLIAAIASVTAESNSKELSLVNLARLEHTLTSEEAFSTF